MLPVYKNKLAADHSKRNIAEAKKDDEYKKNMSWAKIPLLFMSFFCEITRFPLKCKHLIM